MSGERIEFYPVRIAPTEKPWAVDWSIRHRLPIRGYDKPPFMRPDGVLAYPKDAKPIGLETIYPPTDTCYERRPTPKKPNRMLERKSAMIPRYIYVRFDSWDDWHALLRFSDVLGPMTLVGMREGEPYVLSQDDEGTLKALGARGSNGAETAIGHSLRIGENVEIADWYDGGGLYAGRTAKLLKIKGSKATVLFEFLNALRPVKVPVGALKAA